MRQAIACLFMIGVVTTTSAQTGRSNLVAVEGGAFRNARSNYFGRGAGANVYVARQITVHRFLIGRYEVTQKEWREVMGGNPSKVVGDPLPVTMVNWYDCIAYCNERSIKEGLKPYYTVDKTKKDPNNQNEIDDIKWTVTLNAGADGYRLPTEEEWEYAAGGGQRSRSYLYSGSNDVDAVAWYYKNSGDHRLEAYWNWHMIEQNHGRPQPVGAKAPNELGLYDMAGNVREWCWNWYGDAAAIGTEPKASAGGRVWRGGGWMGGDFCCASSWRAGYEASGRAPDQGFRVCRDM